MPQKIVERLERIDYLIKTKSTGSPAEFAVKLGISRSRLYEYLNLLKNKGAPIVFSRKRKCFYYETEGSFLITFIAPN
ncbi:MAG: HTH domain-containing protein [Chitinophagaceae bacterium]|nr:MAG: HTH domain-containing protein [Chitinophagaceae bacterium]